MHSQGYYIRKKLFRNKLTLFGFAIIGLFALVAIPGYLITPDSTPMANQMHLSIASKKPGFTVKVIQLKKNPAPEKVGFFTKLAVGQESTYEYVALTDAEIVNGEILVTEYTDEEDTTVLQSTYPLSRIEGDLSDNIYSKTFWLGTDRYGRDMLSRMIIGARISLMVGFISVIISLLIGVTLGLLAGYYKGKVDSVIMWLINVVWSLPTLLLVIAFTFALGKGFWQIFVAVGLSMWVEVARIVRGQVFSVREKEYVQAAKVLGFSDVRIIFKHILPNVTAPIIVISTANFASAILLEAGLSFLGLGVQPPMPSWGMMIKEHYGNIVLDSAFLAIVPGVAIMLLVMAFNFVGNGLRDALDVNLK